MPWLTCVVAHVRASPRRSWPSISEQTCTIREHVTRGACSHLSVSRVRSPGGARIAPLLPPGARLYIIGRHLGWRAQQQRTFPSQTRAQKEKGKKLPQSKTPRQEEAQRLSLSPPTYSNPLPINPPAILIQEISAFPAPAVVHRLRISSATSWEELVQKPNRIARSVSWVSRRWSEIEIGGP